jgi:hypothetical protein
MVRYKKTSLGRFESYVITTIIMIFTGFIGIIYPHVGDLKGYIGVTCGFLLVYLFPTLVFLVRERLKFQDPSTLRRIDLRRATSLGTAIINRK